MEKTFIDSLMALLLELSRKNPHYTYVLYVGDFGDRYVIEDNLDNYLVYVALGYVCHSICVGGFLSGTS